MTVNSPKRFVDKLIPILSSRLKVKNVMALPRLEKVVVNMGVTRAKDDAKVLDEAESMLAAITGQKPVRTVARKSISSFGLRKGKPIGCKVTLRGVRMYEFVGRLTHVVLPRIRDFKGVSVNSFDESGNYNFGVRDISIFPEVSSEIALSGNLYGLNITFGCRASDRKRSRALLECLGMPFVREEKK